jgi:hypothetical protein
MKLSISWTLQSTPFCPRIHLFDTPGARHALRASVPPWPSNVTELQPFWMAEKMAVTILNCDGHLFQMVLFSEYLSCLTVSYVLWCVKKHIYIYYIYICFVWMGWCNCFFLAIALVFSLHFISYHQVTIHRQRWLCWTAESHLCVTWPHHAMMKV